MKSILRKLLPWLLAIGLFIVIVVFPELGSISILVLILSIITYIGFKSSEFLSFLKKKWYMLVMVILALLFGVYKGDTNFWNDFEEASVVITIVYSITIYILLYRDKNVTHSAVVKALPSLILGVTAMGLSVLLGVGEGIHLEFGNGTALDIPGDRKLTMALLTLGALLYALVNYTLLKGEGTYEKIYMKSLQYSDIPVVVTFALLWASSFALGEEGTLQYEAFYGGAVAFQMLFSNIVWTFVDDPIIEKILTKKTP